MGKKQDFSLPDWVSEYVISLIRGYGDREKYLEVYSSYGNKVTRLYRTINKAVDDGFASVCLPCELKAVRESLRDSVSYEYTYGFPGGRGRFYELRKKCVFAIAKNMHII